MTFYQHMRRRILPLSAGQISLRNGARGRIVVRPQIPVRPRRLLVMESDLTRQILELDEILSDAIAWGLRHDAVYSPPGDGVDLHPRTTVEQALRAERAALTSWRSYEGAGLVATSLLVGNREYLVGNREYLLGRLGISSFGGNPGMAFPVVDVSQDLALEVENQSGKDREYLLTWMCEAL